MKTRILSTENAEEESRDIGDVIAKSKDGSWKLERLERRSAAPKSRLCASTETEFLFTKSR